MSIGSNPQKPTHTHTDSFLKSLKQIGTICFTFSFLIFPNFASADNIPTTNPGCTTTVLGAQNIANGSAALEPDFSANTINTTWYSNGTQLTGNGIPSTCTYDEQLLPPTPADRPGYVFGGWKVKAGCSLAGLDASVTGTSYATFSYGTNSDTYGDYGLSAQGDTWGATFSYGKIVGIWKCTATNNGTSVGQIGTPPDDELPDYYETAYCWCRVTGYITNDGSRCSYSDTAWVLAGTSGYIMGGIDYAQSCAALVSDYNVWCSTPGMEAFCQPTDHTALRRALFGQTQ